MRLMKRGVLVAVLACAVVAFAADAWADRIVAVADEWCLSGLWNGESSENFAVNSFSWLTASSGNRSILVDQGFDDVTDLSPLFNSLTGAGFTVTVSSPSTWTASTFNSHGAVLWERGHGNGVTFDGSELVQYIESGGGVMLVGGGTGLALTQHNTLLNEFGITEQHYFSGGYTVTSFSPPHPVTSGVTSLGMIGPSPLHLTSGSTAQVLSNQYGINWIVVAEVEGSSVPEPTTLAFLCLGVAGLGWHRRKRKAKAA